MNEIRYVLFYNGVDLSDICIEYLYGLVLLFAGAIIVTWPILRKTNEN